MAEDLALCSFDGCLMTVGERVGWGAGDELKELVVDFGDEHSIQVGCDDTDQSEL